MNYKTILMERLCRILEHGWHFETKVVMMDVGIGHANRHIWRASLNLVTLEGDKGFFNPKDALNDFMNKAEEISRGEEDINLV